MAAMMGFEEWRNCILSHCGSYRSMPAGRGDAGTGSFHLHRRHGIDIAEMACRIDRIERQPADIRRDSHEYLFLLIQKSGRTKVTHNGQEVGLDPGDCLIMDSTLPAELRYDGQASAFTSVHLPRGLCLERRATPPEPGRRITRAHPLYPGLMNLLGEGAAEGEGVADYLFDFVALMFRPEAPAAHAGGFRDRLGRYRFIRDMLERHLCDSDLTLDRLAAMVHMSRRQLQRDFSDNGTTFSRLLAERRVRLAASHLRHDAQLGGRLAIADLAFRVGFSDLSHFNRSFREHYGLSPSGYRADCRRDAAEALI